MTRILVTAFEPFGGDSINASLEAVRRLPALIAAFDVTTTQLPTSFSRSLPQLERAIARHHPDVVLCVGQAADRAALCVERVAVNLQNARIADNDGVMPVGVPIIAGGPAAYISTLPVQATVTALQAANLPAMVSDSAGTFVCNHVFYGLMHLATTQALHLRAGLLHVPRLLECADRQPMQADGATAMKIEDIVRGIVIAIEVAAAQRNGPALSPPRYRGFQ